jgi:DNA-binding MarR family transcriptional regulator
MRTADLLICKLSVFTYIDTAEPAWQECGMAGLPKSEAQASSSDIRLGDFPFYWLSTARGLHAVNMTRALRPVGISQLEWRVLATLAERDGRSIGDLATATTIERANLGRLVERMAKAGLLERRPAPADRRVMLVFSTAKGRALHQKAIPFVRRAYEHALEGLSPEERATLMDLLRRLAGSAGRPFI